MCIRDSPSNGSERLIFPTSVGTKCRFNTQFIFNLPLISKTNGSLETESTLNVISECLDYILAHVVKNNTCQKLINNQ